MVHVSSSAIADISYDAERSELRIRFLGGRTYIYRGVPPSVHAELMAAGSKGAYVNRHIKPHYPCRRHMPGRKAG